MLPTALELFPEIELPLVLPTIAQNGNRPVDASPQTLNVLHVINGEHFSGAERVQQNLGLHLEQFGYTSHFVCLKPDKFRKCPVCPRSGFTRQQ